MEIEFPKETEKLGRIAAQTAKQVIAQRVREAEREKIHGEFGQRIGEVVNATVKRFESGDIIAEIGRVEAPDSAQGTVARGELRHRRPRARGDQGRDRRTPRARRSSCRAPIRRCSSSCSSRKCPEIYDGTVMIRGAVREAGDRAKVAVFSRERDVDPVGACVGMRGTRVQAIIRELRGEKIDIVEWSEDPVQFVTKALSPARVQRVSIVDDEARVMEVVVEDRQLSLAIGKKGQNVRLAAKLTGWKIDIKSDEDKRKEVEAAAGRHRLRQRRAKPRAAGAARHPRRSRRGAARRRATTPSRRSSRPRPRRCWRCRASIRRRSTPCSRPRRAERAAAQPHAEPAEPPSRSDAADAGETRAGAGDRGRRVARSAFGHCPDLQSRRAAGSVEPGGDDLLKKETGIDVKSASSSIEEIVARQFVERQARKRQHRAAARPALRRHAGRQEARGQGAARRPSRRSRPRPALRPRLDQDASSRPRAPKPRRRETPDDVADGRAESTPRRAAESRAGRRGRGARAGRGRRAARRAADAGVEPSQPRAGAPSSGRAPPAAATPAPPAPPPPAPAPSSPRVAGPHRAADAAAAHRRSADRRSAGRAAGAAASGRSSAAGAAGADAARPPRRRARPAGGAAADRRRRRGRRSAARGRCRRSPFGPPRRRRRGRPCPAAGRGAAVPAGRSAARAARARRDDRPIVPMPQEAPPPITKLITLAEGMTVKDLADKLEVKVKDVLKKLIDRRMMMTINSTLDADTAQMIARDFGAEVLIRSFEEELTEVETEASNPEDLRDARAGRHRHGPRRPRQDDAARRDPRDEGRRARSRRHHAAHRRVLGRRQRPPRRVPRHAGPRSVHDDARPRRQGHRHRRPRRRGRRRRHAADAGSDRPREGGQRADRRGRQQDRQGRTPTPSASSASCPTSA